MPRLYHDDAQNHPTILNRVKYSSFRLCEIKKFHISLWLKIQHITAMARYLDPRYDFPFRYIFGVHKHLCLSLINSMLPLEGKRKAVTIAYETSKQIPNISAWKHSVVDVRCTDSYGRQFIVEMQMFWSEGFKSRVLFNASKAYVRQLGKAEEYKLLHPVYAISFINDIFEKSPEMKDEYYHHHKIVNVQHTEKRIDGLELIFIELPKFKPHTRATRKLHDLWLRFLTEINESTREAPPELLADENIREAVRYSEIAAYSESQLIAYDDARLAVLDERSALSEYEGKGLAKGLREGLAKGREEGMAKGREEGMAAGFTEVSVHALKKGMSPEDVSELTGFAAE
jgi:predicted transposase/invertase (TIGR01784 family)